mgnify:CR=1 FL=1
MNTKMFFSGITLVERVLHLIILAMVLFLCFEEINSIFTNGSLKVQNAVSYTHLTLPTNGTV